MNEVLILFLEQFAKIWRQTIAPDFETTLVNPLL